MKALKLTLCYLATGLAALNTIHAQGTAFTYQGILNDGARPANGNYDMSFSLFPDSASSNAMAGPIFSSGIQVTNGLFTVSLDFGEDVFAGMACWLDISVRTNGGGAFTELSPRQQLTPSPYAIFAGAASNLNGTLPTTQLTGTFPAEQLSGTVSVSQLPAEAVTNNANGVTLSGAFAGDGSGLAGVPYAGYTGDASNAPGSPYALYVHGDMTVDGSISITNEYGLVLGLSLGTDGSIFTGGYIYMDNGTGAGALPAASRNMFLLACDVPNGIVGYRGAPFLLEFNQVGGGTSTNWAFPLGCNTFAINNFGQVVLNNPLSEEDGYGGDYFPGPQLVFQSERRDTVDRLQWVQTNYWGINQTTNYLTIGPLENVASYWNTPGTGTRKYLTATVQPSITIDTNGGVAIGTTLSGDGSGLSNVTASAVAPGTVTTTNLAGLVEVVATSDFTTNRTASINYDPALTFSGFVPGHVYHIQATLILDVDLGAPATQWGFNLTSDVSWVQANFQWTSGGLLSANNSYHVVDPAQLDGSPISAISAGGEVIFDATFLATTPGAVALTWGPIANSSKYITRRAGSWLRVTEVN